MYDPRHSLYTWKLIHHVAHCLPVVKTVHTSNYLLGFVYIDKHFFKAINKFKHSPTYLVHVYVHQPFSNQLKLGTLKLETFFILTFEGYLCMK